MSRDLARTGSPSVRRSAALAGLGMACAAALTACGTPTGAGASAALPTHDVSSAPVEGPAQSGDASVHPVTTVVITDDPAVAAAGDATVGTWPGLLGESLNRAGSPLILTQVAVEGAGFAADGSARGGSFTDMVVERVVHDTQLVVFFDSDVGSPGAAAVADGALAAFNAVEEAAPDARVVVIGPYRYSPAAAEPAEDVREAIRDAARLAAVAVDYIDPVTGAWPTGPTAPQVADLILPHVSELVAALARSGAFD